MTSSQLPKTQLQVLHYLYRFRFLTSRQISTLLNHKNIRLTNYHLQALTAGNYIGRHYTRSLGLANQPAVYFLMSGSFKVLEGAKGVDKRALRRVYREKIRSLQFIARSSFIAQYFLHLRENSQKSALTLHFFTKTDLLAHPYVLHPLPDAYFARVDKTGKVKRYFVELIDDLSPRFVFRNRVKQYNDYLEDGKFEQVTGHSFPTILFICSGVASLAYLKKHLARIYDEISLDQTEVYLATHEQAFEGNWEMVEAEE